MRSSHSLVSVDGMGAVRMARAAVEDAQRAVRDRTLYKPHPPVRPPRRKGARQGRSAKETTHGHGMQTERVSVSRRYREARPWLSAREVRMRASEDLREREAMAVGSATKHTYASRASWLTPQASQRIHQILDSRQAKMPRELRHIKRVPLPPVLQRVVQEEPPEMFGQGDKVKLAAEKANQLDAGMWAPAFGALTGWEPKPDSVGTVIMGGGKRWKGDCLVEMDGQRLWFKSFELEMVERSSEPRPSTAEELAALTQRRAAKRKTWVTSSRLARDKWNAQMGGIHNEIVQPFKGIADAAPNMLDRSKLQLQPDEDLTTTMEETLDIGNRAGQVVLASAEADVQMELAIELELPTDPAELEQLQTQLRADIAAALGVDIAQVGEIELSVPD